MISTWGSAGGLGPIFSSAQFYAPLVSSLALTYGTGSENFARATAATCFGYAENAAAGASQQLLTIPAGIPRFSGARFKASTNTWDIALSDGTPIPSAQLLGYLSEGAATNFFLNSGTPATQTTGSLNTGTYTCWLTGTGSIAISAGTATITGAGTATAGSPVTFTVTVAGTVVCTVAGTPTTAQVENTAFPTSYIATAGAPVARNADVDSYPTAGNILAAQGAIYGEFTPNNTGSFATVDVLWSSFVDVNNYTILFVNSSSLTFRKTVAATIYDASIAITRTAGTTYKVAISWGAAGTSIVLNATIGTPNANALAISLAGTIQEGAWAGGNQPTMQLKNRRIWQTQLPNSTLQAITR